MEWTGNLIIMGKVDALKKKLAQIEGELSQKDNDTYRRQNAAVS